MLSLEELQHLGALSSRLKCIKSVNFSTISSACKEGLEMTDKVVSVENPLWFATSGGAPVTDVKAVYSSNGSEIGRWDVTKRTFYLMVLKDSTLVTTKTYKIKEKTTMAETQSFEELEEALGNLDLGDVGEMKEADSFSGKGQQAKELTPEELEKQQKKEKLNNEFSAIRQTLSKGAEGVNVNPDVIRNNCLNGRLVGFVTPTDETIKIAIRNRTKTDAQGRKILKLDAPNDVKEAFAANGKAPMKWYEKESCIAISQVKPQKHKGMIIKTPEGTDLSLTTFGNEQAVHYDVTKKTMKVHVLDNDTASVYLAYNYGDKIKEDEAVLGSQATMLTIDRSFKMKDDGTTTVVTIKPEGRKALLIPGNYFPLKLYDTISMQDPSAENRKAMELNIEALFAKEGSSPDKLCAEYRKMITQEQDGSYKYEPIEKGTLPAIETFWSKDETVKNVRLPKRDKHLTKSGSYTYKNVYIGLDDEKNGPMAQERYQAIFKATGMEAKDFVAEVSKLGRKTQKSSGKGVNSKCDYITFLKGAFSGNEVTGIDRKFADLQASIDGLV